jgi:cytochrome c biogenesis protein CcmG/thiol:disulfide interchange protein DsbE
VIRYAAPLLLFMAVVGFLWVGLDRDPTLVPSPLVGKPAPAFVLPTVREPDQTLRLANLAGQVALLNVWATWCFACRAEHEMLLAIARDETVPIYGLNYKDDRADAVRWLNQLGDPYIASGFDQDGRVGIDLGVYGAPETFVLDRNGVIAYKHIGPITAQDWQETIRPLVLRLQGAAG